MHKSTLALLTNFLFQVQLLLVPFVIVSSSGKAQPINYSQLFTNSTFQRAIDLELPVGIVEGQHGVSNTGAATYTIPIKVAPGTNGMVPTISINYSSQVGNGMLGYGWDLSASSMISSTAKTIQYDGENNPPNFIIDKTLSLDGVRFLPGKKNAAGCPVEYLAPITDYSFIRPMQLTCDGGKSTYQWLQYISKDGKISEYGSDQASIDRDYYYVNKIVDETGNYMTYHYDNLLNEKVLTRIDYTGNVQAGLAPYNSVRFVYGERDDKNILYKNKEAYYKNNLLTRIQVYVGNDIIRTYTFDYGFKDGYSFLNSVVEYNQAGEFFNPTIFRYGDLADVSQVTTPANVNTDYFSVDIDGDGVNDIVEPQHHATGAVCTEVNTGYKILKGNTQGSNFQLYANVVLPAAEYKSSVLNWGWGFKGIANSFPKIVSSDFNSDGRDDIVRVETFVDNQNCTDVQTRTKKINVLYSSGNGQFNQVNFDFPANNDQGYMIYGPNFMQIGDLDGDKQPELLITVMDPNDSYRSKTFAFSQRLNSIALLSAQGNFSHEINYGKSVQIGDFDGDGDGEIYIYTTDNFVRIYDNEYSPTSVNSLGSLECNYGTDLKLGDFNADGLCDLLFFGKGIRFAKGIGYTELEQINGYSSQEMFKVERDQGHIKTEDWCLVGDFNGDNLSDIAHEYQGVYNGQYRSEVIIYYSKGYNNWNIKTYEQNFAFPFKMGVQAVDLNGDNRYDIYTDQKLITFRPNVDDRSVVKIRNGFGNETGFTYAPLNSSSHVENDHTNYGYRLLTRSYPMTGVTKSVINGMLNGITPTETEYRYKNSVFDKRGGGFIGFNKFSSKDIVANRIIETTVSVDIVSNAIRPLKVVRQVSALNPAQSISSSEENFSYKPSSYLKVFIPDFKTTIKKDLLAGTTAVENSQFDNYANVLKNESNVANGLEKTLTTNTFSTAANFNNPYPAKVVSTTIVQERQGSPAITTSAAFEYDNRGLIFKKIDFWGLPKAVTTTYSRNFLGNVTDETISSPGLVSKLNQFKYDVKNRFIIERINPLYQHQYFSYDDRNGNLIQAKAIDQQVTSYGYDGFGRLTETIHANYIANEALEWYIDPTCNSVYRKFKTFPGKPAQIEQYDALSRIVKVNTAVNEIMLPSPWGPLVPVQTFNIQNITYDTKGNKATEDQAHFPYETDFLTQHFSYDWLNRPISACDGLHGCTTTGYSYSNGNLITTNTSPIGQVSSSTVDAAGRQIKIADNGGILVYEYDSRGQVTTTTPNLAANNAVIKSYDEYGRQKTYRDPNAGMTQYVYNAWGELLEQTDANSNIHSMQYNLLGQVINRQGPEGSTQYTYYTGVNIGEANKLQGVVDFNGNGISFNYDMLGRLVTKTENINSKNFRTDYVYNQFDQLIKTIYDNVQGSSVIIENGYNGIGRLKTVRYNGRALYDLLDVNGKGQITRYSRNNTIFQSENKYDFGYLTQKITAGHQDYKLEYDYPAGNIVFRADALKNADENFAYDNLNRLTYSAVSFFQGGVYNMAIPMELTYQGSTFSNGNIASKDDVGHYKYGTKPHAVNYVTNSSGIIPTTVQDIKYTPFQKPGVIEEGAWKQKYTYAYDYERSLSQLYENGLLKEQRYYAGDNYEVHADISAGDEKHIIYVPGGDGICAVILKSNDGETIYYPFIDHLGSIQSLVNENRNIAYEQAFDAWGRYRDPQYWTRISPYYAPPAEFSWVRGFTGHEHLPQFALINMNARMYDPVLGRMLSADNVIANTSSTQAYNLYSYANNNPLSYIDPDGNIGVGVTMAVAAAISALSYSANAGKSWNIYDCIISAYKGAWASAASYGVGDLFMGATSVGAAGALHMDNAILNEGGRALLHGVFAYGASSGESSVFYGAVASSAASSLASMYGGTVLNNEFATTVFSLGVGGVTAQLSGGNFWDGMKWAAISHMSNQIAHNYRRFPRFATIKANYPPINPDGSYAHPSKDDYDNQCAIRVGYALMESGVDLSSYDNTNKTSEGYPRWSRGLANWLTRNYGPPIKMSQAEFHRLYVPKGPQGIIYIQPPPSGVGHIDIIYTRPDLQVVTGSGYYTGTEIWYWPIK